MIYSEPRLLAAGDASILIEWADEIDDAVNDRVHTLTQALRGRARPEIRDLIPAYSSLLVCFDPHRASLPEMREFLQQILRSPQTSLAPAERLVEIPTRYGGAYGPDLPFIGEKSGLSEAEVIRLHASVTYRVYLIGFAPGFAYLGSVPVAIAAPRLDTPRTRVPAGSVGIAGRQTGIYPMETPGGWRLIGRTDERLFDPTADPPSLLRPGDRVRFVPIG
ncbi:MAG: 5-oxoprolinase subunit PxpB [Chloroflexi bacterium]|nr:5-oxoprolinase subunit PxpB [Chloroflexota bacterium]